MLKFPTREQAVLRYMLDARALEVPHEVFLVFDQSGARWTTQEVLDKTRACAAGLQARGVRQGDTVLSWLPNGEYSVLIYLALSYMGAIYVPVNTAYKGGVLEHVIGVANASLMVVDSRLANRLSDVQLGNLESLVVVGTDVPVVSHLTVYRQAVLFDSKAELQPLERPIEPWDPQTVIYTSGTTGPSKGVLSSYMHYYFTLQGYPYPPGQRSMLTGPMFHSSGAIVPYRELLAHGSIVVFEAFSTQTFWSDIKKYQITSAFLLGAMTTFLLKQEPGPEDRNHSLRELVMVPLSDDSPQFSERFGIDIRTAYNMTELCTPIVSDLNPKVKGTCGRQRAQVEVRIVDEHDIEVPDGVAGELVVRAELPWAISTSYYNNPVATAGAWRNGWFHSGDAMVRDADGNFFFVDRIKDAIRRRGENISSFEVEKEIVQHPAILDAAVVAAKSEFMEDEVLAVVTLIQGTEWDPVALLEFLQSRLAHFMIPRYVRVVEHLPMTASNKIEKHKLRSEGLTEDTWDREAAGIFIKRDRFGSSSAPAKAQL